MSPQLVGNIDTKLISNQIKEGIELMERAQQLSLSWMLVEVLINTLSPLPNGIRMKVLKNIAKCPSSTLSDHLIGRDVEENKNFLLNESHRMFRVLFDEMLKTGSNLRDLQRWNRLQNEYITAEALERFQLPFTLCAELRTTYPRAREENFDALIPTICENEISLPNAKILFSEIAKSFDPNTLIAIIVEALNKHQHSDLSSNKNHTSRISVEQREMHCSNEKFISSIEVLNLIGNMCPKIFREKNAPSLFWALINGVQESSFNGILRALENFDEYSQDILDELFSGHHPEFFGAREQIDEKQFSLVLNLNFKHSIFVIRIFKF